MIMFLVYHCLTKVAKNCQTSQISTFTKIATRAHFMRVPMIFFFLLEKSKVHVWKSFMIINNTLTKDIDFYDLACHFVVFCSKVQSEIDNNINGCQGGEEQKTTSFKKRYFLWHTSLWWAKRWDIIFFFLSSK